MLPPEMVQHGTSFNGAASDDAAYHLAAYHGATYHDARVNGAAFNCTSKDSTAYAPLPATASGALPSANNPP